MLNIDHNRKISVPFWSICLAISLISIGWMIASFLLCKVSINDSIKFVSGLGVEIFQAIFIASSVGVAINIYLKHAQGDNPKEMLERCGVSQLLTSRYEAHDDLLCLVKDTRTQQIDILGISLRDFLTGSRSLRDVWFEIRKRLEEEKNNNKPNKERLRVRLLVLDPVSNEGTFRHNVEKNTMTGGGLLREVPQGVEEVLRSQKGIFNDLNTEFLQIKLYEHCPFSFIFITNNELFVEQYCYRDHSKLDSIPIIKYNSSSPQYAQFRFSIEAIWNKAIGTDVSEFRVGTAGAINKTKTKSIFRFDQRGMCGNRELESIKKSSKDRAVDILAITGKFFMQNSSLNSFMIPTISENIDRKTGRHVRIAIINPISQQGILRAIADSYRCLSRYMSPFMIQEQC